MAQNQRIDIIIPAYNAHDTILRTLASIAAQTIRDELYVTIVDDCSDHDYSSFVSTFSPHMSIREIRLKKNGGPGVARQYGIDNTSNPLITFIDADDTFSDAFALQELRRHLESDAGAHMIAGAFVEESDNHTYITHTNDMVWTFGKLYSRSFLEKYKIRFNPYASFANEDSGFNKLINLCSTPTERVKFVPNIIYYWHYRPDSIVRRNNAEYTYNQSFVGLTDNMIYAITEARKNKPFSDAVKLFTINIMCDLYAYYIETVAKAPQYAEQNWGCCKKFYSQMYAPLGKVNQQALINAYSNALRNRYTSNNFVLIPCMGFWEFLSKLKEETESDAKAMEVAVKRLKTKKAKKAA